MPSDITLIGVNESKIHRLKDRVRNKVNEYCSLIMEIAKIKLLNEEDEGSFNLDDGTGEQDGGMRSSAFMDD